MAKKIPPKYVSCKISLTLLRYTLLAFYQERQIAHMLGLVFRKFWASVLHHKLKKCQLFSGWNEIFDLCCIPNSFYSDPVRPIVTLTPLKISQGLPVFWYNIFYIDLVVAEIYSCHYGWAVLYSLVMVVVKCCQIDWHLILKSSFVFLDSSCTAEIGIVVWPKAALIKYSVFGLLLIQQTCHCFFFPKPKSFFLFLSLCTSYLFCPSVI